MTPVNLREVYGEPGDFSVKFLLRPDASAENPDVPVTMTDPDGQEVPIAVHRWGTKVHVSFRIDETIPDGIAVIRFQLGGRALNFATWVFK